MLCGCSALTHQSANNESAKVLCSSTWYQRVEKKVITGDGQGHGPDLGSAEWRSVVEFKLGIRGNKNLPKVDTRQWCEYINKHFLVKAEQN